MWYTIMQLPNYITMKMRDYIVNKVKKEYFNEKNYTN